SLRRWDPADGHVQAIHQRADAGPIAALAVSADGKSLATVGSHGDLKTWDLAAQLAPTPFAGIEAKVRSLALSPDGKVLASSTADGVVQLWDTARGRQRGRPIRFESREIRVAFSPDGKILGTLPYGSTSERLKLWDPTSGRELDLLAVEPDGATRYFAFAPDGKSLATAGGPVTIWGLGEDRPFRVLKGRTGLVRSIAFSPDGSTVAAAGGDGSIPLWDAARGASLAHL